MGYPKLRKEWVINAFCDGSDSQDWGESECAPGLCSQLGSHSSLVSSAQAAQSKWDILVTGTRAPVLCTQCCQSKAGGCCTDWF